MTQRELAARCGLSPAYVANLERNTSEPPPLKTCKALARALGVDWQEVWHRSFSMRLRRWLRREGYTKIAAEELLEIAKRIDGASRFQL